MLDDFVAIACKLLQKQIDTINDDIPKTQLKEQLTVFKESLVCKLIAIQISLPDNLDAGIIRSKVSRKMIGYTGNQIKEILENSIIPDTVAYNLKKIITVLELRQQVLTWYKDTLISTTIPVKNKSLNLFKLEVGFILANTVLINLNHCPAEQLGILENYEQQIKELIKNLRLLPRDSLLVKLDKLNNNFNQLPNETTSILNRFANSGYWGEFQRTPACTTFFQEALCQTHYSTTLSIRTNAASNTTISPADSTSCTPCAIL